MAITDIFRSKDQTAAALQFALDAIDLVALNIAVGAATEARTEALIVGEDKDVRAAEQRLAAAQLDLDRGQARKAELERRLAEALAREALDAVRSQHAATAKAADEFAAKFGREYQKLAGGLAALLAELAAIELRVRDANEAADKAGLLGDTADRIPSVENRVMPFGPSAQFESVLLTTRLRPLRTPTGGLDATKPNWPPANFQCVWS